MAHTHDAHSHDADALCDVAHGEAATGDGDRTLVAVFASPVADYLLRYGADLGFRGILFEPDPRRSTAPAGFEVVTAPPADLDGTADIVLTDHHRPELAAVLHELLGYKCRWIGVMGSPRHPAPYLQALAELGARAEDIARVHRPIGLNIGSRTPPEIAIATLAGLLADRNGRPGGFTF
ncbi:XdhC family protein [Nonomuraea guangzhouensis]|uniref:XdhC family protein n=1 Tax=Nonomuraea guangzhouensis TaxID=1291555 RepID=A0ABW4G7B4_9ACTN|nr:XdhC family protein [Nonomuraea guangzhouensis]